MDAPVLVALLSDQLVAQLPAVQIWCEREEKECTVKRYGGDDHNHDQGWNGSSFLDKCIAKDMAAIITTTIKDRTGKVPFKTTLQKGTEAMTTSIQGWDEGGPNQDSRASTSDHIHLVEYQPARPETLKQSRAFSMPQPSWSSVLFSNRQHLGRGPAEIVGGSGA